MAKLVRKGGKGSGNWGHAGRPGKVGGSAKNGSAAPQGELFDRDQFINVSDATGLEKLKYMDTSELGIKGMEHADFEQLDVLYSWMRGELPEGRHVLAPPIEDGYSSWTKENAIENISDVTGLSSEGVGSVIDNWLDNSNGTYESDLIQTAVRDVFHDTLGTEYSDWQTSSIYPLDEFDRLGMDYPDIDLWEDGDYTYEEKYDMTKQVVSAMYDLTQAEFKRLGITHVNMMRGFVIDKSELGDAKPGDIVSIDENAAESWSIDEYIPAMFNGGVEDSEDDEGFVDVGVRVDASIPVERILSTPMTGFGSLNESEFVVLGSSLPDEARLHSMTAWADDENGNRKLVTDSEY